MAGTAVSARLRHNAAKARLRDVSNAVLECRGDHHTWPKLPAQAGTLPKGLRACIDADGGKYLENTCSDCGRVRWRWTDDHWRRVPGEQWRYRGGPSDFSEQPGLDLARADYQGELDRRFSASLGRAAVHEETRRPATGGAGPVRFQAGVA